MQRHLFSETENRLAIYFKVFLKKKPFVHTDWFKQKVTGFFKESYECRYLSCFFSNLIEKWILGQGALIGKLLNRKMESQAYVIKQFLLHWRLSQMERHCNQDYSNSQFLKIVTLLKNGLSPEKISINISLYRNMKID